MCPPESLLLYHNGRNLLSSSSSNLARVVPISLQLSHNSSEETLLDKSDTDTKQVYQEEADVDPIVQQVLTSAPPPWHSVALVGLIAAAFTQLLPSWEQIDEIATISTFARAEPWIGGVWQLGLIRLCIASSIWATSLHILCGPGWHQVTKWKPASKLKSGATIKLSGIKTMFPFTSWSWNLLGLSYTLNAFIALCVATQQDAWIVELKHNWLLRFSLIIWEIAAPCAILVSTVVRFAIWEMVLKGGGDTANLKSFRNIMMHNINSVFVLMEVALFGALPVRYIELSLAPLFGVCYVLFTWSMSLRWSPGNGPQFIYYFFDTTMGKVTSISLLALLCALLLFYVLFATARIGLDTLSKTFPESAYESIQLACHASFVVLISSAVCRFRDYW